MRTDDESEELTEGKDTVGVLLRTGVLQCCIPGPGIKWAGVARRGGETNAAGLPALEEG